MGAKEKKPGCFEKINRFLIRINGLVPAEKIEFIGDLSRVKEILPGIRQYSKDSGKSGVCECVKNHPDVVVLKLEDGIEINIKQGNLVNNGIADGKSVIISNGCGIEIRTEDLPQMLSTCINIQRKSVLI